ncbi:MAG TPA: hypothetical protein VFQ61_08535 [Polyangiaceae bacterium]|nr:hypothetical protein [Polyangiaceae bacterium]
MRGTSDPGGGVCDAQVGSVPWAQRWRLEVQGICHNVPREPERLALYWGIGEQHEVWRLLNRPDGSTFNSLEELCEERYPWGFGRSREHMEVWMAIFNRRELPRTPDNELRGLLHEAGEAMSRLGVYLRNARQSKANETNIELVSRAQRRLYEALRLLGERAAVDLVNTLAADEPDRPPHPPIE